MEDKPKIVPERDVEFVPSDAQPDILPFSLDNILTISAEAYGGPDVRNDYEFKGINLFYTCNYWKYYNKKLDLFKEKIPKTAVAVVAFQDNSKILIDSNPPPPTNPKEEKKDWWYIVDIWGTALIPKKK